MHPKRLRGNTGSAAPPLPSWLHLAHLARGCVQAGAVDKEQSCFNSSVGWKEFKIISLDSSASYSWVPDSHCFNSSFPNHTPGSELGEAQLHSGCTAWVQGVWSLLSFPGQGWRMSFLTHLSLETLAPPGFLLVFPPFALCFRTAGP